MFTMVTKILGVIALTGWMSVANASLIYDFSWDSYHGTIIGEIYGLSDNGYNLEASGLVLTSVDGTLSNIDVLEGRDWLTSYNSFDVVDGEIVKVEFYSENYISDEYFELNIDSHGTDAQYFGDVKVYPSNSNGISFVHRVTVPEPSSVILMLLGLAGLSFARYRKQY
jgi:hypothetical protein